MTGSDIGLGSDEYSFIASDSEDVVDTDWYEGPTVTEADEGVDPEYGVIVAIEPPSRQVQSGDVANFVITVLNTGNRLTISLHGHHYVKTGFTHVPYFLLEFWIDCLDHSSWETMSFH